MPAGIARSLRPLSPLHGASIKVQRSDDQELRVVVDRLVRGVLEMVAIDQIDQYDLDFLQSHIVSDATPGTGREGHVERSMAVLDKFGVPPVRPEFGRVRPVVRVVVQVWDGGDDDGVFGEDIATRQNHLLLAVPRREERGTVDALGFFDELVEVGEGVDHVVRPLGLAVDSGVNEFLDQTVLMAGVCDQGVDEPGQE